MHMPTKPISRRTLLLNAGVAGLSVPLWSGALAQPSQAPIRLLVGVTPGGTTDTMARTLAVELAKNLNRTVVVENRPGAGGNIAAEAVARAAPDGNTLLVSFTSHAINASLYPNLSFDPVKDFTPITCIATSPSVLVVHPSLPVSNVKEFIALAKSKPGRLNFAIGGIGSSLHMAGDAFKMQAGVYIVNVAYRGTAPAVTDVLGGQVEAMFAAVGNVQQHVKAGKLKAIGVTSTKRLAAFPEVATVAEALPGFESSAWFGLFGPAKMPPDLAKRVGEAARAAVQAAATKRRIEFEGAVPVGNSAEEFGAFVQSEVQRWGKVVKYSGAKPE
jgi:tripartite-type tricarboxylate transporter receptor subunit TctC